MWVWIMFRCTADSSMYKLILQLYCSFVWIFNIHLYLSCLNQFADTCGLMAPRICDTSSDHMLTIIHLCLCVCVFRCCPLWPLFSTSSMPFSLPSDGRGPNKTKHQPNRKPRRRRPKREQRPNYLQACNWTKHKMTFSFCVFFMSARVTFESKC